MNKNTRLFISNSYEFSDYSILEYFGTISDPIFNTTNMIKTIIAKGLPEYLEYLEIKDSTSIDYIYIITPDSILKVQNNQKFNYLHLKKLKTRNDPYIIISKLFVKNASKSEIEKLEKLKKSSNILDKYFNLDELVIFSRYLEQPEIKSFLENINLIIEEKFTKKNIFLNYRQSSFPTIRFLSFQISEMFFDIHYDLPIKFQVIMDLLSSLSIFDMKFIEKITRMISNNSEKTLRNIIQYFNIILLQFFLKSGDKSQIEITNIHNLILQSLSLQFYRYKLTEDLFNSLNIYSGILLRLLDYRIDAIFLSFLSLELLRKELIKAINYGETITELVEKLKILLSNLNVRKNNYRMEFLKVIKEVNYNTQINHFVKNLVELISSNKDYFKDPWIKFILFDINHTEKMHDLINYITSENYLPAFKTYKEFKEEIKISLNFDFQNPINKLYLINLLYHITIEILHTTNKDPLNIFRDVSIFKLIYELYQELDKSEPGKKLIHKFKNSYYDVLIIDTDDTYRNIIFGDFTNEEKLKQLIHFFSRNDQIHSKNYLYTKRLRTLKFIISILDKSHSNLIHQLLDLLEIHSHSITDRSYVLIQLIRSYLDDRPLDQHTRNFMAKYYDLDEDIGTSNVDENYIKNFLENTANNSQDIYTIDKGKLNLKMKQKLELVNNELDLPSILPLGEFNFFPNEELFRDYFIFHNAYNHVNKILEEDDNHDFSDLFYYILNHNPYAEKIKPHAKNLTKLRHKHLNVVDHIQFELLKIRILTKIKPHEALSRLQAYMQKIEKENLNPALDNYFEIIELFRSLATTIGNHEIIYRYDQLQEKLEIYKEYFIHTNLKDYMYIIYRLNDNIYRILNNKDYLIPVIGFIFVKEFENDQGNVESVEQLKEIFIENPLTTLLHEIVIYWNEIDKMKILIQAWLKFSEDIIETVDKLATKFTSVRGLTETQLHLLHEGILTIEDLYDILDRNKEPYYLLRSIFLSIRYLIDKGYFDQVEAAFDELYNILKNYNEIFFYHPQILELVKIGRKVDYTNWIEVLEVIYYQNAPENLIQEFNKVLKQDIEKYDKERVQKAEDVYQPIIDYFTRDNVETDIFMNKFLVDKKDKNPE